MRGVQVYEVAVMTPLTRADRLRCGLVGTGRGSAPSATCALCCTPHAACSEKLGNNILLKREDLQPGVKSFKLRGAYNRMARLTPEQACGRKQSAVGAFRRQIATGIAFKNRRQPHLP